MSSAVVTNIQGYSLHDGPGIRTVVFLKGCPLRCKWCANPENLVKERQVGFLDNLCVKCMRCASVCRTGAIIEGDGHRIDRSGKCTGCGDCAEACLYSALVVYGEEKTAADVFKKVRRDKMFYDESGGGVTVSGGEPLLYDDFVTELFTMCRDEGINTCIETCGAVSRSAFEKTLNVTDYYYFDLKLIDPAEHKRFTGADNAQILDNARFVVSGGANVLFRCPLIRGVNDGEENIRAMAESIKSCGGAPLQLMPYHRLGQAKYNALGMPHEFDAEIMTDAELEHICAMYGELGIDCTISK